MGTEATPNTVLTHHDVPIWPAIIVGAGPAGLAVGACLKRAGIDALILEQSERVGASWRGHYDRLHLHTDKAYSALPFAPFPRTCPRYPSRLQVIDYLETYARRFELEPRFGEKVVGARRDNGIWQVQTQDAFYQASNLVIAAGYNREPYLPNWPGQTSYRGSVVHSSQYRTGEPFRHQSVLVVGFGNSGGEIALDLREHGAQPALAVRGPVNVIPRELFGVSTLAIGIVESKLPSQLADALNAAILRVAVGDLTRYGLLKSRYGPVTQVRRERRIPLIDVGTIQLIKRGQIAVYPGIERFTEDGVIFTNGVDRRFDGVILATGYRPRVDEFLKGTLEVYDENGAPYSSGREAPVPGLYFCGYYVSPTGMLREIALEARRISADITKKRVTA